MIRKFLFPLFAALVLLAPAASAEDEVLDGLSWLNGQWIESRAEGVVIEVNWATPIGATLVGTLQELKDGKLVAYEKYRLLEGMDGITLRIEHFSEDDKFAKPKVSELQMISNGVESMTFEGQVFGHGPLVWLTIETAGADQLYSWSVKKDGNDDDKLISYRATQQ